MRFPLVFMVTALLAGGFPADAGPLKLSELAAPGLVAKSISIPGLLARRRAARRTVAAAPSCELLVKFQSLERPRVIEVAPADEAAALRLLRQRADVRFAEKNRRLKRQFDPSDPLLGEQWQHGKIQSRRAWDIGRGTHSVTVAIVDYPFNMNHPDLKANAVQGWDVVNEVPVTSGNDDHSTFSAGMAAGVLDNATGIAGAGNCQILPINVDGYISDMDAAIRWAADHGVRVVNISWEGADSPTLNEAGQYLREQADGLLVMAGVNGTGFLDYANQPYITAVSMTDSSDALRSKYGDHIDFSAPGYNVKSTTVSGYGVESGTSFSSPLVAGVMAVLFAIDPSLTAEQVLAILRDTAVDLGDPGWDQKFGWGRIDFYQAAWLAAAHAGNPVAWSNSIERLGGTGLVVSAEFHPGLGYSLWGRRALAGTDWMAVDAVARTNAQRVEYVVDPGSATQAFFKVAGEVDL